MAERRGPLRARASSRSAGRPNVGKSTIVNAIVGAQGRDRLRQAADDAARDPRRRHRAATSQLVLVDLPGVQRPRDVLTERMQRRVEQELGAPTPPAGAQRRAGRRAGRPLHRRPLADRRRARSSSRSTRSTASTARARVLAAAGRGRARRRRRRVPGVGAQRARAWPSCSTTWASLRARVAVPVRRGARSLTSPPTSHLAELIRERRSAPHASRRCRTRSRSCVEEIERPAAGAIRVRALLWVETSSQKGILIGAGGAMIKRDRDRGAQGARARPSAGRVHLDLSVRVRRDWRADEGLLDRLGLQLGPPPPGGQSLRRNSNGVAVL